MNPPPLINLKDALANHKGPGVPSPCVSVCLLDEASGSCKGCLRTLQEIGAWAGLSDDDKRETWALIEARQIASGRQTP